MKCESPDNFLKVAKLLKKLGDLAEALDEIAKKMRFAVEKQKINLEHLGRPDQEGRRMLDSLQRRLRPIETRPIGQLELFTAKELCQNLIEANPSGDKPVSPMSYHEYVEFTCVDEFKKFRNLPAISIEEIQLCDFEDLCDRFVSEC
jgi:hypothetical protein